MWEGFGVGGDCQPFLCHRKGHDVGVLSRRALSRRGMRWEGCIM